MAKWMPFTAQIKIHPARPNSRWVQMREIQRLGVFIYDALDKVSNLDMAYPGGGQARNYDKFSDYANGVAIKPQFGNTPPQASLTGFYDIGDSATIAVQHQQQLIHCGKYVTGPYRNTPWLSAPDPIITNQVKALVAILENTINGYLPAGVDHVTVFRLDYANIVYGDRGITIPH